MIDCFVEDALLLVPRNHLLLLVAGVAHREGRRLILFSSHG